MEIFFFSKLWNNEPDDGLKDSLKHYLARENEIMVDYEEYGSMSDPGSLESNDNPTFHSLNDGLFDQERAGNEAVQRYFSSAKYGDEAEEEHGFEPAMPRERDDHAGYGAIFDANSDNEFTDGTSSQSSFEPYTQENPKGYEKRRAESPAHSPPKKRRIEGKEKLFILLLCMKNGRL